MAHTGVEVNPILKVVLTQHVPVGFDGKSSLAKNSHAQNIQCLYALLPIVVKFSSFLRLILSDDPNILSYLALPYWHAACDVRRLQGTEGYVRGVSLHNKFQDQKSLLAS
jgi:hypothetical protein